MIVSYMRLSYTIGLSLLLSMCFSCSDNPEDESTQQVPATLNDTKALLYGNWQLSEVQNYNTQGQLIGLNSLYTGSTMSISPSMIGSNSSDACVSSLYSGQSLTYYSGSPYGPSEDMKWRIVDNYCQDDFAGPDKGISRYQISIESGQAIVKSYLSGYIEALSSAQLIILSEPKSPATGGRFIWTRQ